MATEKKSPNRVSAILKKLYVHTQVYKGINVPLPYKDFKLIMMDEEEMEPVMTYERTVKEKYQLLIDFGYVSKTGLLLADPVILKLEVCGEIDSNH